MTFMDLPLDAPCKPNKGLEGGACNRQSCQAEPALWYNHGSDAWYCADCSIDIGRDSFNLRDWQLNWEPRLGHPMFETREMMDARKPMPNRIWEERGHFCYTFEVDGIGLLMSFESFPSTYTLPSSQFEPFFGQFFNGTMKAATFESERPLTKRQRRRARGKARR